MKGKLSDLETTLHKRRTCLLTSNLDHTGEKLAQVSEQILTNMCQ